MEECATRRTLDLPRKPIPVSNVDPDLAMVDIRQLVLDPSNPRLKHRDETADQVEIAREIAQHYDAISLARLIANNGYYKNSALLVYRNEKGQYIVAEGNRRLTAVLGLTNSEFRDSYPQRAEWLKLSESKWARHATQLPVYIFDGPTTLRPIIAAEHLNRKLSWEPYQKAREIVNLIDVEGYSFDDLSKLSGIAKSDLKRMYRDFKVCKSLIKVGFAESVLTSDFSKLGEVTRDKNLSEYSGLPAEKEVVPGHLALDDSKLEQRLEVFNFVFGEDSVTPDSRQIRDLGKVVTEVESLSHLRETRDLPESLEIYRLKRENNIESTSKLLAKALDQLERIFSKVAKDKDDPQLSSQVLRAKEIAKLIGEL
jgi:hypothetical protein